MLELEVELVFDELEGAELEVDNDSDDSVEEESVDKVEDPVAIVVEGTVGDAEEDLKPAQNPSEQVLNAHWASVVQWDWKLPHC